MPHVIELALTQADQTPLPPSSLGYNAYALFLSLLRDSAPELARELHDTEDMRPFTTWFIPDSRPSSVGPDAGPPVHRLRITLLTDQVLSAFMHAALLRGERPLQIGPASMCVSELHVVDSRRPRPPSSSYLELLEQAATESTIALRFVTPSTFRSRGHRNVVFPEPSLVFGSLLSRWNRFAPQSLDQERLHAAIASSCTVSRYRLETVSMAFGAYSETGFVGNVTYDAAKLDGENLRALNALADYADFAGVGAKTSMGMGQVRRRDLGRTIRGTTGSNTQKRG